MTGTTPHRDDGQVMLLSIAFGVLALLLVTVVVSASSVHLERKELFALADLAALDAAAALDEAAYFGRTATAGAPGCGPGCPPGTGDAAHLLLLSDASVRAAVEDYLADAAPSSDLERLTLVEASTPDGRTAQVRLQALARPALLSWITAPWSDGVLLDVTTSARAG